MECEWEQKFLSGIDPTIVFQDLLNKILVFSTSKSSNYGLTPKFEKTISKWTNDPKTIIEDMASIIKKGLENVRKEITNAISNTKKEFENARKSNNGKTEKDLADTKDLSAVSKLVDNILSLSDQVLKKTIGKYKIEIQGIARALTGAPSTPWHITIGNPLRPIFCAGDMYMSSEVTLTLGPTLAFNDLPSSIKASFTLQNARAWGLQEIIAKFNAGSIRVSTTIKDDMQINSGDKQNATDSTKTGTKQDSITGISPITQNGSLTKDISKSVASNPINSSGISTVAAGPQTLNPVPNFANNFVQSIPSVDNLSAGVSNNIASVQTTTNNLQNQVNNGVAGSQIASTLSAANTTKEEVSSSVLNSVATQTSGVIPFDNSVFSRVV